jgi:DNA repair photolyase
MTKSNKSVIYETTGRAREYNELAINLFSGCGHRCEYCYAWFVTHSNKERFFQGPKVRVTPADVEKSAYDWIKRHTALGYSSETRPVLLCFTCDPYQPIEEETRITRSTIEILHEYGMRVTILTKGGRRAMRDFDLLRPGDAFAVTLTCLSNTDSERWEPGASSPFERLESLQEAHKLGIETWVSLEPVLYPSETKILVDGTKDYVDHYKVGKLNYHEYAELIDWKKFGWEMKEYMDKLGVKYMIKKDLWEAMGVKEPGGSTGPKEDLSIKCDGNG